MSNMTAISMRRSTSSARAQQHLHTCSLGGIQRISVMQLMLDTFVVKELAELTASHTHHNTGTLENARVIRNTAYKSDGLKQKYSPVIG
ncbi:hypothetical protein ABLB90_03215 [Photorhabdus bodei]|uniref:Uncharacterized protein n=2 Tax=Morganellaceae TaxID=1903414 RepID=A0ABX0B4D9_9GAMM|nr:MULTISPECIES: hypothetical protein [Photorhabdus]MCC8376540.1 hypothetical protein [Photorhabdus bodei]MCT8353639.1 hypothetical protein [Photorhabdus kayaii]MDB6368280.1 hypothetical protein [Photorhabdus bodei]NDL14514.1 hypothetical protein [Photorhabdus kayaii]NDL27961.1 hypothetical protein [Photorhabdus kayaii]